MKKIILICLFTGLVSGVRAQKNNKMTEDEKTFALKVLEWLHEFETSPSFNGPGSLREEDAIQQDAFPWNRWVDKHKDERSDLLHLFRGLKDMSIRPVEDSPNACELVFRCRTKEPGGVSLKVSFTPFDSNKHLDKDENCIGFRSVVFCGLEADVQLHLTDRRGRPVHLMEPMWIGKGRQKKGEEYTEAWYSIVLPLSVPWQEVTGGHIDVKLFPPQEYDRVEVAPGDAEEIPKKVTFGSKEFIIEKVDSAGLVIAADGDVLEQLAGMEYLYCKGGKWYKVSEKYSFNGDVKTMLKLKNEGNITFEEWLKKKRIDPNNLEGTIENFVSADMFSDEVPDLWGKRINTRMYGDSLLLYMPVEAGREKTIASLVLPVPSSGNDVNAVIDEQLCRELLGRLGDGAHTEDDDDDDPDISESYSN